jgi:hypothetical protein
MFWQKYSPEVLEAKTVARCRKNLRFAERLGRWGIAFFLGSVALVAALAIALGKLVVGFANNPQGNVTEFWFGLVLGMFMGGALHRVIGHVIHLLGTTVPDDRDRLLVRYHDALHEVLEGAARSAAECGGVHREVSADVSPKRQIPLDGSK